MYTSQVVKDRAGQCYIVCLRNSSLQTQALKPEKFVNAFTSFQFVTSLQTPFGFWQRLATSNTLFNLQRWQNSNPTLTIEHYAAEALAQGFVQVYKINFQVSYSNAYPDRKFKKDGMSYLIAPAAYLLMTPNASPITFNHFREARSLLNSLVSSDEQIKYLAESLELPVASNNAATSQLLKKELRQALFDGEIVVIQEKETPTTSQSIVEEVIEIIENSSSSNMPPPASSSLQEETELDEPPICELTKLTVVCAHDGRKQVVTSETGFIPKLSVVASPTTRSGFDKLTATVETNAPCGNHADNSSSIQPQPKKTTKGGLENIYELASEPITNPLRVLWLPSITPNSYKISANACERFNPCAVQVDVYPKIKWNISVGYSFGNKELTKKQQSNSEQVVSKLEDKSGKFHGKAELYYDEVKKDFASDYQYDIEKVLRNCDDVFKKIDTFLEKISDGALNRTGVKLEVFWPNVAIKYEAELLEDKSSIDAVSTYALSVSANPLIGMKGSLDLFPTLLKFAHSNPYTKGVAVVLDAVVKGVGDENSFGSLKADVQLVFSVDVKLFINFSTKGTNGKDDANCKSEQGLSIDLMFEGLLGAKGHVWVIKFEKNYRAGIKTGFVGKTVIDRDDIGYFWYLRFLFNGLTIVLTKYEKLEKNITTDSRALNRFSKVPNQTEETTSKEYVWLEPSPDEDAPNDTDTAEGSASTQSINKHYLVKF